MADIGLKDCNSVVQQTKGNFITCDSWNSSLNTIRNTINENNQKINEAFENISESSNSSITTITSEQTGVSFKNSNGDVIFKLTSEKWEFELEDGTIVTKNVIVV